MCCPWCQCRSQLWTQQLLEMPKIRKEFSGTGNSHLVCSVTAVAPSSVLEEGSGYTPTFWIWGPRGPPVLCWPPLLHLSFSWSGVLRLAAAAWVCLCDTELVSGKVTSSCGLRGCVFSLLRKIIYRLGLSPSSLDGIGLHVIFWAVSILSYFWVCV